MARFSWKCKGCNTEINRDEECVLIKDDVQLRGEYNGAGDVYGNKEHKAFTENDNVVAWHSFCYDKAKDADKKDMKKSSVAENKGKGEAREKFKNREENRQKIQMLAVEAFNATTSTAKKAKTIEILKLLGFKDYDLAEEIKDKERRNAKQRETNAKKKKAEK